MLDNIRISSRIAGAILLHKGEITLTEISALPFVEDHQTAQEIAAILFRLFDVEKHQRKTSEYDVSFWEEVIKLKKHQDLLDGPKQA